MTKIRVTKEVKQLERSVVQAAALPFERMRRFLFSFPYPKLALLVLSIIAAYNVFALPDVRAFFSTLGTLGYLGMLVAGLLFSFGFTTPFAVGLLITLHPQNILIAALIGGFGALLADMSIYKLIKFSFMDEFERLQRTAPARAMARTMERTLSGKLRAYLLYALAGFIIASPLPDEIGISMLAGLTAIEARTLALFSFIMNTLGIFIILMAAQAVG